MSKIMIRQKPISLKLYEDTYSALELECQASGMTRSRVIHQAIHEYIRNKDNLRRFRAGLDDVDTSDPMMDVKVAAWVNAHNTEYDQRRLRNYMMATRKSLGVVLAAALHAYLDDYDKRPFSHL